jgi:superfamily I DNA/RNA helicase
MNSKDLRAFEQSDIYNVFNKIDIKKAIIQTRYKKPIIESFVSSKYFKFLEGMNEISPFCSKARDFFEHAVKIVNIKAFNDERNLTSRNEKIDLFLEKIPDMNLNEFFKWLRLKDIQEKLIEEKNDKIKIMTIHASKGLEFDTVFVGGLSNNLPKSSDILEERRIMYVAITRAKRNLYLLTTGESFFVDEMGV